VTARALAAIGALYELSVMRIRLMAVRTFCMRHRFFEISPRVTRLATYADVFPEQRICRFRVIEFRAHRLHRHAFPSAGVVARLARPRHRAPVRIAVTGVASIKFESDVLRFSIRSRQVTFLAGHLRVQPSQRIARARVVKMLRPHRDGFPVIKVVTLQAILSQAPVVFVLVTRYTITRQAEESVSQIFVRQFAP